MRFDELHKSSLAGWVLPVLFAFIFSLEAWGNPSCPDMPNDPSTLGMSNEELDSSFYARYPYVFVIDEGGDIDISDDDFYRKAASVVFKVSKYDLPTEDPTLKELRDVVLPQICRDSLRVVRVKMRGAASPEGPVNFNRFLSEKRQLALYDFVKDYMQIPQGDSLLLETETEDYTYLYKRMVQDDDPDSEEVKRMLDKYVPNGQYAQLKRALQSFDGGRLWRRILVTYFPSLRAARLVIVCQCKPQPQPEPEVVEVTEIPSTPLVPSTPIVVDTTTVIEPWRVRLPRRELMSVKSNLLFDFAYVPGYDRWCPIPNLAVEYYPLHGHFTYGFSLDFPWWQHYHEYKFFQFRNYQFETRYYFRSGDISKNIPGQGAAFRGWYLQGYAHAGLFGICFDKYRGWEGEGLGAGVGAGYVLPISRDGHWRLEFNAQVGFFIAKYDPYQYGNPKTTEEDDLYYYKWTLDRDLFKRRQYRFNWIGPTRVGVTLVYDLLYRRIQKPRASFRSWEWLEDESENNE